ncbi:MAG: glycosyltransferase family 2 protein [Candidatus Brocadiia bacterium]|jgi:glycosyltransferase involved in cell wall biosynthesis|nr:glycosyltransferase family 2 protein [Candidatus Brocadiia bacterium]
MGEVRPGESGIEISVVIPAYNEEESIGACLDEVLRVMNGAGKPYEIVVVDDGSTDRTRAVLKERKESLPELVIVGFESNCGQSAAFDAGFKSARGAVVVTMDADLQNDPEDIPKLVELTGEWDMVCGWRETRHDSLVRRISSRIANGVRNALTGESIRDVGCSIRAMRAECLRGLKLYRGMHRFLPTLVRLDGWSVTEVPVGHRPRRWGRTKYGIGNRLFRALRDLVAVRWMRSRWLNYTVEERIE